MSSLTKIKDRKKRIFSKESKDSTCKKIKAEKNPSLNLISITCYS